MPSLGFSGSNLATVAYAEVDGVAGASTVTNSGVRTTRVQNGIYVVVLPTTMMQEGSRDLIFVQIKNATDLSAVASVRDTLAATKTISLWSSDSSTPVDESFSILILRTTITPPTGAPA